MNKELSNPASERAVLAGICQYGFDVWIDIDHLIEEKTFTLDVNKVLYQCIKHTINNNNSIDFSTILSAAQTLNFTDFINSKDHLKHIQGVLATPIKTENIKSHATKIRRLQFAREIRESLRDTYRELSEISGEETVNHILSVAERPLQEASIGLVKEGANTPKRIGESIDEYLAHIESNPNKSLGIQSGFSHYDAAIGGGFRRKCVDLIAARPKALKFGSKVYTKNGYKLIEDISIGDVICHPNSGETVVTDIWPHEMVDIYRIHFRDGDFVDCSSDHLWSVQKTYGDKKDNIKTTEELINDITYGKYKKYKWNVKLTDVIEFQEKEVPLDPYFVGVLLGDGSVSNNTCVYHTADNEIHEYMSSYAKSIGCDVKIDMYHDKKCKSFRVNSLQNKLREIGIFGCNCYNKFIPKDYIYNSTNVRLAILAGLLDTDGDCCIDRHSGNSRSRFCSVSLQLCLDVKEIVQSLGGLCSINKTSTKYNKKIFSSYRCEIRLPNNINPFRLSRKASNFTGRKIGPLKRTITHIKKIGKDNAKCITISNPDGLFVTDNFVVTHNCGKSALADNVALHVAGKLGIPVLLLDTEMSDQDHYNRLLANCSEVEINEVAAGKYLSSFNKTDRVRSAARFIKTIPYSFISIAGTDFDDTLSIARRWLLKEVGFDENGKLKDCLIIYDYLKLMTSDSISNNLAEFQVLGFQITKLHNFCVENDCPCLSFVQLNRDGITKESTDAVSGSDRLIWLCTSFSIFKEKTEEERAHDGIRNGNRKLIPIVSRHGPGIEDSGYICVQMDGSIAKVREIGTIREIKKNERNKAKGIPDIEETRSTEAEDEGDGED